MKKVCLMMLLAVGLSWMTGKAYAQVSTGEVQGTNTNTAPLELNLDVTVVGIIEGRLLSAGATIDLQTRTLTHTLEATSTGTVVSGNPDYNFQDLSENGNWYGYKYSTAVRSSGMGSTSTIEQLAQLSNAAATDNRSFDATQGALDLGPQSAMLMQLTTTPVAQPIVIATNSTACGLQYAASNDSLFCGTTYTATAGMDRALLGEIMHSDPSGTDFTVGIRLTWQEHVP